MTEPSAAFLSVCLPEVVLGVCLIEEGTRKGRGVPGGGRVLWEAISLPGTPLMEALEGDSTRVLPSTALGWSNPKPTTDVGEPGWWDR